MLSVAFFLLFGLACADKEITAAGVSVKIKGQSGKMSIGIPLTGGGSKNVDAQMVALREKDASDIVLGAGGSSKHSFNSFATQDFTFSEPEDTTYAGLSVAKITFESTLVGTSKVKIHTMIFKVAGDVKVGNDTVAVSQGAVKFNVELQNWAWCDNSGSCTNKDGVGDSIELDISMSSTTVAATNTTNTTGGSRRLHEDDSNNKPVRGATTGATRFLQDANDTPAAGTQHDFGDDVKLLMLNTYSTDAGTTWVPMPAGYPKREGSTFTLKFPKWSGTSVLYDPIVQAVSGGNIGATSRMYNLSFLMGALCLAAALASAA